MKMHPWVSIGLRVEAPGNGLLKTHAMVPTPVLLSDCIRVLFASCDADLRGRVYYVDLEREMPHNVIHLHTTPVLDLGADGCFDADGVNPCHLLVSGKEWWLYYVGWQRFPGRVPYTLFTGLAVSHDQGCSFERIQETPILQAQDEESYFRTAPFVQTTSTGYEMLYVGGSRFIGDPQGKLLPRYSIRRTKSIDGINWSASAEDILTPDPALGEIGFGRPRIEHLPNGDVVLMFSVRTERDYRLVQCPYDERIADRSHWTAAISPSVARWDSEMTCFGATCRIDQHSILFYNGNGYGKTGFGLALHHEETS